MLENGWSEVIKALAAAGQAIPSLAALTRSTTLMDTPGAASTTPTTTTISTPSTPVFSAPSSTQSIAHPSPSPLTTLSHVDDSTRHLARMATIPDSLTSVPGMPQQRVDSTTRQVSSRTPTTTSTITSKFKYPRHRLPHHLRHLRSMHKLNLGSKRFSTLSQLPPYQRRRFLLLLLMRSMPPNHKGPPPPPTRNP